MSSTSVILAVLILLVIIAWLYRARLQRWWRQRQSAGSRTASRTGGRPSRATEKQLLRLTGGNRAAAERLVSKVRQRYPDRPEQWCWEKAIFDIERDRRA
jgi:uncharacterized protein HemY